VWKQVTLELIIKSDHLVVQSRFSKYFPEAVSDKYRWINHAFHATCPGITIFL
jgi:hypothetical protein